MRLLGGGLGFILAQPISLSLGAARSLPATKTRPVVAAKMSVDGLSLL